MKGIGRDERGKTENNRYRQGEPAEGRFLSNARMGNARVAGISQI